MNFDSGLGLDEGICDYDWGILEILFIVGFILGGYFVKC